MIKHIMLIRRYILIAAVIPGLLSIPALSPASDKLKVAASIYPLAHFAGQAAGGFAEITNVMPPGSEPHEYEPTPRDIREIYESDLFLFNGAGLDSWAQRLTPELEKRKTIVIEMVKHPSFISAADKEKIDSDPHIWLDPLMAIKEVEIIRDTLISADPAHETEYRTNSAAYIRDLNKLHEKYAEGLKSCNMRDIIVTHDAYGYLSSRYNLTTHAITGISPEEEPSPKKMVGLAKLSIKKNIRYIFFEQLVSPKLAETIAREVGAETLVLNPIGGLTREDIEKGRTYISVMEDNLVNLRKAMECGE